MRFRAGDHTGWVTAETRNIGIGGAFVASPLAQPVGTQLVVEVMLPTTEQRFVLPSIVRWTSAEGMGVQFVGVDIDVLLELNDYFATLTGGPALP